MKTCGSLCHSSEFGFFLVWISKLKLIEESRSKLRKINNTKYFYFKKKLNKIRQDLFHIFHRSHVFENVKLRKTLHAKKNKNILIQYKKKSFHIYKSPYKDKIYFI